MIQAQVIRSSITILALWLQNRRRTQGQLEGFRAATGAFFSNPDRQTLGPSQALDVLDGRSVLYYPQHHCRRARRGFWRRHRLCTLGTLGTRRRSSNVGWVRILCWNRSQSTGCRQCTRRVMDADNFGNVLHRARSRSPNRGGACSIWAAMLQVVWCGKNKTPTVATLPVTGAIRIDVPSS